MNESNLLPSTATESVVESAAVRSGVLARKYRPETFDSLIGQNATVRMLQNALVQDRVAQALVFSGVRGTGKTTLARIVAKGLNCLSSDAPTPTPCGTCQNCLEIAAGNSLDVQEIDAASHTGVDHIRDLIGSVSYRAAGRYKVYILDEVHMLSTSAFNALLKTLEEPPAHVRFIFATTEIRKIPPTVLSRTQRFALCRVRADELAEFLAKVVDAEQATAEPQALELVARAGEGSVRDALSMLDQFLSGSENNLTAVYVQEQLGQASSGTVLKLFQALMDKDGTTMLELLDSERTLGTDPISIVREMMGICHQISRRKILGDAPDQQFSEADQQNHHSLSQTIAMGQVARLWQVLLKGVEEIKFAPDPVIALEMLMIRAHYLADVPTPAQILKAQPDSQPVSPTVQKQAQETVQQNVPEPEHPSAPEEVPVETPINASPEDDMVAYESENPAPPQEMQSMAIKGFADLVSALEDHNESFIASILRQEARVISFALGRMEFYLPKECHEKLQSLGRVLEQLSGQAWQVHILDNLPDNADDTLDNQDKLKKQKLFDQVKQDGLMQEVADLFPGSRLTRLVQKDDE